MHFIDTSDIHVFAHYISAPPLAEAQRYSVSNLHSDVLKIYDGIILDFYPGLPQYLVCRSKVTFKGALAGLQVSNLPQTDVYLLFHGYSSAVKLSVSTLIFARWLVKVGSLIIHES